MNSARANTGETSKFCMDNEKRHAVTNFHTYIISMVRAVRPYFSLHKITFKYNLHTTNKFLDWAKKKMNSNKYHFCTIKRAKYNLSRLHSRILYSSYFTNARGTRPLRFSIATTTNLLTHSLSCKLTFIVQNARGVTNFRRYLGSGSGSGSHRAVSRPVAGYRIALRRE